MNIIIPAFPDLGEKAETRGALTLQPLEVDDKVTQEQGWGEGERLHLPPPLPWLLADITCRVRMNRRLDFIDLKAQQERLRQRLPLDH